MMVKAPADLMWKFRQKCEFYDINESNAVIYFMERFLRGDFDNDFNIPKD